MKIQDYLHLYIGCDVSLILGEFTLLGVEGNAAIIHNKHYGRKVYESKIMKPILRPLSDIQFDEIDELALANGLYDKYGDIETLLYDLSSNDELRKVGTIAYINKWLLSRGFDLFNLIENGLAIDKTKGGAAMKRILVTETNEGKRVKVIPPELREPTSNDPEYFFINEKGRRDFNYTAFAKDREAYNEALAALESYPYLGSLREGMHEAEVEIIKHITGGRTVKSYEGIPYDYEEYFEWVAIDK